MEIPPPLPLPGAPSAPVGNSQSLAQGQLGGWIDKVERKGGLFRSPKIGRQAIAPFPFSIEVESNPRVKEYSYRGSLDDAIKAVQEFNKANSWTEFDRDYTYYDGGRGDWSGGDRYPESWTRAILRTSEPDLWTVKAVLFNDGDQKYGWHVNPIPGTWSVGGKPMMRHRDINFTSFRRDVAALVGLNTVVRPDSVTGAARLLIDDQQPVKATWKPERALEPGRSPLP